MTVCHRSSWRMANAKSVCSGHLNLALNRPRRSSSKRAFSPASALRPANARFLHTPLRGILPTDPVLTSWAA